MVDHYSDCVVQHTLYKLYVKYKEPKLFKCATKGNWDCIPKRCRTHPREAAFVHKYPPNDTALQRILRARRQQALAPQGEGEAKIESNDDETTSCSHLSKSKIRAVSALVNSIGERIVSHRDSFGQTALHLACMDPSLPQEAVNMILSASPTAASLKDIYGKTPLHYACMHERVKLSLIVELLLAHPEACLVRDRSGQKPLSYIDCHEFPHIISMLGEENDITLQFTITRGLPEAGSQGGHGREVTQYMN